jgi:hypothetical protein
LIEALRQSEPGALAGRGGDVAVSLAGCEVVLVPEGALYWPGEEVLVVADLHLEKGSALAARGQLVPPYDSHSTLARLAAVCERLAPRVVVALGDSFHDGAGHRRLPSAPRGLLAALQAGRDWIWVAGNHDPAPPVDLGGTAAAELFIAGVALRHEPSTEAGIAEIAGHLHPAARVRLRGKTLRRRCFAGDGRRLILPAFGAFTGGLNVRDAAFDGLFDQHTRHVWALGEEAVHAFAWRQLCADARSAGAASRKI